MNHLWPKTMTCFCAEGTKPASPAVQFFHHNQSRTWKTPDSLANQLVISCYNNIFIDSRMIYQNGSSSRKALRFDPGNPFMALAPGHPYVRQPGSPSLGNSTVPTGFFCAPFAPPSSGRSATVCKTAAEFNSSWPSSGFTPINNVQSFSRLPQVVVDWKSQEKGGHFLPPSTHSRYSQRGAFE